MNLARARSGYHVAVSRLADWPRVGVNEGNLKPEVGISIGTSPGSDLTVEFLDDFG